MIEAPAAPLCARVVHWQANRYQLWSLLDMLRFHAGHFVVATALLEQARMAAVMQPEDAGRETIGERLESLIPHLEGLPIAPGVVEEAKDIREQCKAPIAGGIHVLTTLVGSLERNLQRELGRHIYFCIPAADMALVEQPEKWFGEPILNRFPEAKLEMRDATRCLAFGQWTASVFHSMGIAEFGLREVADRLKVPFARPVELENWKNIIDQIEKQIRALEQQPKTADRDQQLQRYSKAASHFFYIKEAWRNHVSHLRGRYDEDEARLVVQHIRALMTEIATWP